MDLAKAAKLASDVVAVGRDADLEGLDAVAADEEFVRSAGQQIRGHAEASKPAVAAMRERPQSGSCGPQGSRLANHAKVEPQALPWTSEHRLRRADAASKTHMLHG